MQPPAPDRGTAQEASLAVILLRLAVLIGIVVLATWGAHEIRDLLNFQVMPSNEKQVHRAIMLGSLAYVGLLALPFVPGAEIGLALLAAFGAAIAPLIYAATVVSMMLAFAVGRLLSIEALGRVLRRLRLHRAAALVTAAAPLSGEERMALLLEGGPPRLVRLGLRNRYLALALAVNVPGNSVIGGGGGIMLMAGLSGIFAPLPTLVAILVAVSPVPLAIYTLGLQL